MIWKYINMFAAEGTTWHQTPMSNTAGLACYRLTLPTTRAGSTVVMKCIPQQAC